MGNNQRQSIQILIRQTRLLNKLERPFAREVRAEKNRYIVAQADNYRRSRMLSNELLIVHKQNLTRILIKHQARAIRVFAGDVTRSLPSAKAFYNIERKRDMFTTLLQEWTNEEGANKVQGIAETMHNDLRTILSRAIEEEIPSSEVIKRLLTVRSLSNHRSRVIARTETHNAAMFASQRSAEIIANDVGITILKRWIPALDERTRVDHAAMRNHKAVAMDGKFTVGGEKMDRPGDSKASARNVINCRCVLVYEEQE